MLYMPAMAVSIMVGADERMLRRLADLSIRMAEQLRDTKLPRFTLVNINAPAIPPEEWKPLRVCPLSQAYYQDGYEKRVSPLGQTYLWIAANDTSGVPMEEPEEGSDYALMRAGHVTCTFLGAFADHNAAFGPALRDFDL